MLRRTGKEKMSQKSGEDQIIDMAMGCFLGVAQAVLLAIFSTAQSIVRALGIDPLSFLGMTLSIAVMLALIGLIGLIFSAFF